MGGFVDIKRLLPNDNYEALINSASSPSSSNPYATLADIPAPSLGDWAYNGNTVGSIKSIGTIDNFELPFITNNVQRAVITNTGDFAVGATSASARMHVRGANTSSGSFALIIQNANPTTLFHVANDGGVFINGGVGNNETFGIRQVSGKNIIVDVYNNSFGRRHFTVFDNGGAAVGDSYVSAGGRPADFPVAIFYPAANVNYGSLHLNSSGGASYQLFSNRAGVSYNHVAFINGAGGGFTLVQNASQYYELQLQSFTGIGTNMLLSSDTHSYVAGITAANFGVGVGTPLSKFEVNGAIGYRSVVRVANGSFDNTFTVAYVDADATTQTLEDATTCKDRIHCVKLRTGIGTSVTINSTAGNVEGGASYVLTNTIAGVFNQTWLQSDGANWNIIGR